MLDNKFQNFEEALEVLKTKSASQEGKTAIFFSGDNGKNMELAENCHKKYPDKSYTINQTEAGKFLHSEEITKLVDSGLISDAQEKELWNKASQMFAKEAKGGVIAFVNGGLRTGNTFVNHELPILLEKGTPINWIDTATLNDHTVNDFSGNFKKVVDAIAGKANCFDDQPPPPSGGVTVASIEQKKDTSAVLALASGASSVMGDIPAKTLDGLTTVGEYGLRQALGIGSEQSIAEIYQRNSAISAEQIEASNNANPTLTKVGEVTGKAIIFTGAGKALKEVMSLEALQDAVAAAGNVSYSPAEAGANWVKPLDTHHKALPHVREL